MGNDRQMVDPSTRSEITVTVTMLTPEQGGRSRPVVLVDPYRPHLRAHGDETYLGVQFPTEGGRTMTAGEPLSFRVRLLYDLDYSRLQPGVAFDVLEGAKIVGTGVVA